MIATGRERGDRVRVTIRDAGVGLPVDSVGALFDAFYTTKTGGMGIGLFVSRSIIETHHGRLRAEPNGTKPGATFAFSIPINPPNGVDSLSPGRDPVMTVLRGAATCRKPTRLGEPIPRSNERISPGWRNLAMREPPGTMMFRSSAGLRNRRPARLSRGGTRNMGRAPLSPCRIARPTSVSDTVHALRRA